VAELDRLFGYHGHKHWTGLTLADMVGQVEYGWDEPYGGLLWKFMRFVNTWNNSMLHHSAMGVIQGLEWPDPSATPVLKLGPSAEWQQAALFASYWCYGMLVLAALRCGSDDRRPAMREFLDTRGRDFRELTEEETRGVGRNDPCPCGSGKKFKRCHGR
jgi:SEC-C motif